MNTLQTEVQDITETRKKIVVGMPATEISTIGANILKKFQHEAQLKGFRQGKAPESVIRMRFAGELRDELDRQVMSKALDDGIMKTGLHIYSIVEVENDEISAEKDVEMTFTVDILPSFELPDYKDIELNVESTETSPEEIDKLLNQILSQRAEFKAVEKAAEPGDYVRCSYEGKIGDELIADILPESRIWGTQKNTWEEAGADNSFGVSAVVQGLIGMKAGDEKEVSMEFTDETAEEALLGKTALYSIKVEEVREKILPDLDESFLKSMGAEDEAELRELLKESIEGNKRKKNETIELQQAIDQLVELVDFAIPESGLESERNSVLQELMQSEVKAGATEDDFEKRKDELHEKASKIAHSRLKSRLILNRIAAKENIKVDNDDFGERIFLESQQTGQRPEQIVKAIEKDKDRMNRMYGDVMIHKTIKFVVSQAKRKVIETEAEA